MPQIDNDTTYAPTALVEGGTISEGTITDLTCQYLNTPYGDYDAVANIIFMSKNGASEHWVTENFQKKCLLEDTLITMADGTKKPIQDVQEGDLIKSINLDTNEETQAVVLYNHIGDVQTYCYMLMFEDGSSLKTNWTHDVYNATKGTWAKSDCELFLDDEVIKEDGSRIKFIGTIDTIGTARGKRCKFYDIIVSNNCYYADGILCASNPISQFVWLSPILNKRASLIPQNLKHLIASYRDEDNRETDLVYNSEYIKEYIPLMTDKMKKESRMRVLKSKLAETDHITLKISEGIKTTPQIQRILNDRVTWRKEYNDIENELKDINSQINSLKVKYSSLGEDVLLDNMSLRKKFFLEACRNANANLEFFKEHYEFLKKYKQLERMILD